MQALAADVETLRQTLKLDRIGLIAHSFGTRVAQTVQTNYRSSVRGTLLLGSNWGDGLIWFPDEIRTVWECWCLSDEAREHQIGHQVEKQLLAGWDRQGKWSSHDSKALFMAFFMSFGSDRQKWLMKRLLAAQKGFSLTWQLMGWSFFLVSYLFNWADFFLKGYLIDGDLTAVKESDCQGQDSIFQSPSSMLFSGLEAFFKLGGKREESLPVDYRNTLLVTGEFDISTPLERWPKEIPRNNKIILAGQGHQESLTVAEREGGKWMERLLAMPVIE